MSILCGHCHGSHESVAQVRECSLLHPVAENATSEISEEIHPAQKSQEIGVGFYSNANGVFQVVLSKNDRKYAKKLNDSTHRFEYYKNAMQVISAGDRMTLEQAKEFGRNTGHCMVCGALLTNEISVAEGIGPICGGRF